MKPSDIYFKSTNGTKLHGLLYAKPDAKFFCLFSHGNGGNVSFRQSTYELLMQEGCSVFIYDYEGYGKSDGSPSADNVVEDAQAAYSYATKQLGWDPARMVLFGESLGTTLATRLAAKNKCAALILECPVYSIKEIGCRSIPYLKTYPDWDVARPAASTHPGS